jgi:sigma-B regulation protein RsbU (phosphoserine phosphatase)
MASSADAQSAETPFELDSRTRPHNPLLGMPGHLMPDLTPHVPRPDAPTPQPRYAAPAPEDAIAAPSAFTLALDNLHGAQAGLDAFQQEINSLKAEIIQLRRHDETLKFYMLRLDEELRLAARLQQDFLPRSLPQLGRAHFHILFRPAGYVSGDLYDVARLDETHVAFCIVDAVGHGMPAALLTMFIKRALVSKEIGPGGYRLLPPAETMQRVNDALVEQNLSAATFATALYGILDTVTLQVTIASGGHPCPLLLRGETLTDLPTEGPLLGIFADETFTQATYQLQPGDRLIAYSDGLEVALNEDVSSSNGQWRKELLLRRSLPAEGMVIDFSNRLDQEAGSLSPKDDLTMVMLEIK